MCYFVRNVCVLDAVFCPNCARDAQKKTTHPTFVLLKTPHYLYLVYASCLASSHLFFYSHDLAVPGANMQRHVAHFILVLFYCLLVGLVCLLHLLVSIDTRLFLPL